VDRRTGDIERADRQKKKHNRLGMQDIVDDGIEKQGTGTDACLRL